MVEKGGVDRPGREAGGSGVDLQAAGRPGRRGRGASWGSEDSFAARAGTGLFGLSEPQLPHL